MKTKFSIRSLFISFLLFSSLFVNTAVCKETKINLDAKVKGFLESHKDQWADWNISEADGRVLYDLIIKNNYQSAVDIGTSTGHSAIWMAWALSKTGGKLITIEIHEGRYKQALANFKAAGLSEFIDARLADAHELVKELAGPFDFVFSDADKDGYKNYFIALAPKLDVGGCFTAHNVSADYMRGIAEFLEYV
jgi:caffeoyl-CoA O-methyltransferase